MEKADLYSKYNSLQRSDAIFAIENYLRLIKWRNDGNENILDVGSGDGDVVMNLLLPKFPKSFNKLVCTDLSEEMVEYASNKYKSCKISFEQMDISNEKVAESFIGEFDHIFSFYCFHWVQKQERAMANIYKLLKPGGDILIIFLQNCPIFDIYESLAKIKKWAPYMSNVKNYIAPFHHSKTPVDDVQQILRKTGFISRLCRVEDRSFTYPNWKILTNSVVAVNPFMSKCSPTEVQDFVQDYVSEVKKIKAITIEKCNNNEDEEIHIPYKLFVIYASKSL